MIRKPRRDDPEWRAFEQLVARIERDADRTGVTVKSPDRIRCKITGRFREVDASICDRTGRLTTVECRHRRGRQDVTWIEQLATKKKSLGAADTIAVSASGFSNAARQVAKVHGITLKDVRVVDKPALNPLLGLDLVQFSHKRATIMSVGLRFWSDRPWLPPAESDVDLWLDNAIDPFASIFENVDDGHRWSVNDVWHQLQAAASPFNDILTGAPPVVRTACFPYPGNVRVETPAGPQRLGDVLLRVALWIDVEAVTQSNAVKVEYGAADGEQHQRVEFISSEPDALGWRISLQSPKAAVDVQALAVGGHWPSTSQ
jgi:hypothetical protein